MDAFTCLYPALFAVYPVVALLASNMGEIPASDACRSLWVAIVAGLGLVAVMSLALRSIDKGALLSVGYIGLFFAYGHVYDLVEGLGVGPVLIGRHRYLLGAWALAAIAWTVGTVRSRQAFSGLKIAFRVAGVALVALPLVSIARYNLASTRPMGDLYPISATEAGSYLGAEERPDIFYIILDGYGRSDVLRELYQVDNKGFLGFLESRGFYVASQSTSNYSQTILSLASSLNMQYLDAIVEREGQHSGNLKPLDEMIDHSEVRQSLAQNGYQFVAFETGYWHSEVTDADLHFAPRYDEHRAQQSLLTSLQVNEFEGMLIENTLIRAVSENHSRAQEAVRSLSDFEFQKHRMRVEYTLETLADVAEMDGSYFVFAHVISPHPPFVFGRMGEEIYQTGTYSLRDGGWFERDEYIRLYGDQVSYVSALAERAIDEILATSDVRPIIVIQGDHGPGAYLNRASPFESNMRERMSILNAYLVPEPIQGLLYPEISPVNSFRAILKGAIGIDMSLLPDEAFFSRDGYPYDYLRVTDLLGVAP